MTDNGWVLIETLGPHTEPTVVADGDRVRDWTRPVRSRPECGATTTRLIAEAVRRAERVERVENGLRSIAAPIVCAFGAVHGVQLWAGPERHDPPAPRTVAAWDFLSDTELAYHGPGLEELAFARAPENVRVERTPPEAFGAMVRFDGRIAYSAVVAGTDPAGRWQGEVDMRGDDDVVRSFRMVIRVHRDPAPVTRALMYDISDLHPPRPDMELALSRLTARTSDGGVGYVELATAQIYEWAAAPPPPLHRWPAELPQFHPDDLPIFRAACRKLFDQHSESGDLECELDFRVRFADTDWLAVHAVLTRFGSDPPHGLVRIRPA